MGHLHPANGKPQVPPLPLRLRSGLGRDDTYLDAPAWALNGYHESSSKVNAFVQNFF
jgi:hypothetical protein